jgi:hypothetical protein
MKTTTTTLAALLRQARDDLARHEPPPLKPLPARRDGGRSIWRWSGAAACAAVLGLSVLLMLPPPVAEPHPPVVSGFVPLAAADRWPDATEAAWIVRTELPAARLALLGLPYDPSAAAEPVRAELLLHPSGDVLAVRVIR